MNKKINNEQARKVHGILVDWLTKIKWISPFWAKVIAAAILAGLLAAFGVTVAGCTGTRVIYAPYGEIIVHRGK